METYLTASKFQDHKPYDLEKSNDLGVHLWQNLLGCEYYYEDDFELGTWGFALIHSNSRNLYSNFLQKLWITCKSFKINFHSSF